MQESFHQPLMVPGNRVRPMNRRVGRDMLARMFGCAAAMVAVFLCMPQSAGAAVFFVASDGNDANPGTFASPYATIQRAQDAVSPGDTVYIRGGTYVMSETHIAETDSIWAWVHRFNKSGTSAARIRYWAYPGERPVFDFTNVRPANLRVVGFFVPGSWLHFKGIEVTGIQVTVATNTQSECFENQGNNNIYEQLVMRDGMGIGFNLLRGSNNLILNCDAYRNWDSVSDGGSGGNVDGFGCHPRAGGTGNVFRGCRSWFNSDDGYDCISAYERVTFENCQAFFNGYTSDFTPRADGNGFKSGGYGAAGGPFPTTVPRHATLYCLAVRNLANGIYANHHIGGSDWIGNTSYQNATNYNMLSVLPDNDTDVPGYGHFMRNNLGFSPRSTSLSNLDQEQSDVASNFFNLPVSVTTADFETVTTNTNTLLQFVSQPRQPDGALPAISLLRLVPGSDLIDAGADVGSPYTGSAPDLGASEYGKPAGRRSLAWRGDGLSNTWDVNLSQNWVHGTTPAKFGPTDALVFDDLGSASPSVNLIGELWPGPVVVEGARHYGFAGPGRLAGPMSLTLRGTGSLTLNNANTFTGGTTIANGTLRLSQTGGAAPAILGNVNFTLTEGMRPTLLLGADNQLESTAILSADMGTGPTGGAYAEFILGGHDQTLGGLNMTNGGANRGFFIQNAGTDDASGVVTTDGSLTLSNNSSVTLNPYVVLRDKPASSSSSTGKLAMIKQGTGSLTLQAENSHSGGTTLRGTGMLGISHSSALGSGPLMLESNQAGSSATFSLSGGISVANAIRMDSTTGRELIQSTGTGDNQLTGGITITGSGTNALLIANNQTSGRLTVSGGISGAAYLGNISLRGTRGEISGTVTLGSEMQLLASSATGIWTLNTPGSTWTATRFGGGNNGYLALGSHNALATGARLFWSNGATSNGGLDLAGCNQTVAGLDAATITTATPKIINSSTTADSILTLAALAADYTYAGTIADGTSRKVSLVMNSPGRTQSLTGSNSYSGNSTVQAGTLRLGNGLASSNLANTADVVVFNGATLHLNFVGSDTVDELTISGVPMPPGTHGAIGSGATYQSSQITGPGTLTVTSGPLPSAYSIWATGSPYHLSGPAAAFDADPDGDGVANGLEWILGGNPTSGSSSKVPAASSNGSGDLVFSFTREETSIPETTLTLEYDTDLDGAFANAFVIDADGGTDGGTDSNGVVVSINQAASPDAVAVTIPGSIATGRVFARLRVTRP